MKTLRTDLKYANKLILQDIIEFLALKGHVLEGIGFKTSERREPGIVEDPEFELGNFFDVYTGFCLCLAKGERIEFAFLGNLSYIKFILKNKESALNEDLSIDWQNFLIKKDSSYFGEKIKDYYKFQINLAKTLHSKSFLTDEQFKASTAKDEERLAEIEQIISEADTKLRFV